MRGSRPFAFAAAIAVVFAGLAWSQNQVVADQGQPGTQGAWPVSITGSSGNTAVVGPDGGAVPVQTPCVTVVESVTSVGAASTAVPATAQTGRKTIVVCNSPENSGSPILKCRGDGTAAVIGVAAAGQALAKGDCITYNTTVAIRCIADTASTAASSTECQ